MLLSAYNCDDNDLPTTQSHAKRQRICVERKKEDNTTQGVVRMDDLTDNQIHVTTGFPTLLSMLGFIAVICKGDIKQITTSSSTLTWFEEWFLYFEILYGKSISRWVDASIKYKASDRTLRRIYDGKLQQVIKCRREWP
jgi:hypothetical protein